MAIAVADTFDSRCQSQRLIYIDALRVTVIVFVIVHHAAQAYGPTGGIWPVHDRFQSGWFIPFYTANAAFGMGLMFLIAGYFVPGSYDLKGPKVFLERRWKRLGIPIASLALFVHLPWAYLTGSRATLGEFVQGLYESGWQPVFLHLWFVGHILLYSTIYVAWRKLVPSQKSPGRRSPPSHPEIVAFIFALGFATWIVRFWYPVDKWVPLLWVVPAEPAHLLQYVSFFTAGLAAYRGDWFRNMPTRAGVGWLGVGLIASAGIYIVFGVGHWNDFMAVGGFDLPSLLRSVWEASIAVGLSVGLIVAFREMISSSRRMLDEMTDTSFGAYILHPAIVVALQAGIASLILPVSVKFVLVSALGTFLSFSLARLSSRVWGLRVVLGEKASHIKPPASVSDAENRLYGADPQSNPALQRLRSPDATSTRSQCPKPKL